MKENKDIIVCGDIHGMWRYLNTLINKKKPELILQVGDFGWFPNLDGHTARLSYGMHGVKKIPWKLKGIKNPNTEILWCPGNHEQWDELDLRSEYSEVMPRVYYMPRGTTYTLPDGRVVLFMGGAASIDKNSRTPGVDWFPQEMISISELYKLEEQGLDRVDIVISHTCPQEFNPLLNPKKPYSGWEYKFWDSSQEVLSELLYMYKPSLWYFGHFHVYTKGFFKETNTKWACLNMIPETNWWKYLSNYGT